LKSDKSPGDEKIPAEMIQAGVETLLGAEENIWIEERRSDTRLEKTA
jgi:hypothetical protein